MRSAAGSTFIKICGMTRFEDARAAIRAGATAIGFVFAEGPRKIEPASASEIVSRLHPTALKIGVFVDADVDEVLEIVAEVGIGGVQLQGSEEPGMFEVLRRRAPELFLAKAIRVGSAADVTRAAGFEGSDAVFLDTKDPARPAAPPRPIPLEWLAGVEGRVVISGGLSPENVGEVVSRARPFGVDVSRGVEASPGRKDHQLVRSFVKAVHRAEGMARHPALS